MGNYIPRYSPGQDAVEQAALGRTAYYAIHIWMIVLLLSGSIAGIWMLVQGSKELKKCTDKGAALTSRKMPLYMGFGTTVHATSHMIDHLTMITTGRFQPVWLSCLEGALFFTGGFLFCLTVLLGCIYWVWFFTPKDITGIMKRQKQNLWGNNDWRLKTALISIIACCHVICWPLNGFGPSSPYLMLISHPIILLVLASTFLLLFPSTLVLYFLLHARIKRQTLNINQKDSQHGRKMITQMLGMARKISRYVIALAVFFLSGGISLMGCALVLLYGKDYAFVSEILFVAFGSFVNITPLCVPLIWRYNLQETLSERSNSTADETTNKL